MGRFRIKRTLTSHGLTRVHELRDLNTGRLLGRVVLWADSPDVVPELIEAFLLRAEILPEEWREGLEGRNCLGKEEGSAAPEPE